MSVNMTAIVLFSGGYTRLFSRHNMLINELNTDSFRYAERFPIVSC